ncbi:MAG: serine hydrolase domain-containing protein [Bacteroidota bacterium]
MKNIFLLVLLTSLLYNCNISNESTPETPSECSESFQDHRNHPKAAIYQEILDRNRKRRIVGATMLIKDADGIWSGASGMADLANNPEMRACDRMAIASISKPFTAVVIMKLIEEGLLNMESEVKGFVDDEIIEKLANAEDAKIKHLLSHRSGIPDYYYLQHRLDQVNTDDKIQSFEQLVRYAYGKKAYFDVGESYAYSNTNYVLLGIIAERASGKSLKQLYEEIIFQPLDLKSAYFDMEVPFPNDMPKGYIDFYGNDTMVDSEFLYGDEARTPDGGIVIDNLDLLRFFEGLWKGELLKEESLAIMTDWFELPEEEKDYEYVGQLKNGYGLEHFENAYAYAIGHTGGIDGFLSLAFYFPKQDFMFIEVINTVDYDLDARIDIYKEAIEVMFDD